MLPAMILALLAALSVRAHAAISCEWAEPGRDPLTVARVFAIARMDGLSTSDKASAGLALLKSPADRVLIWKDSITSTTRRWSYGSDVYQMGFGRARTCDITRATWRSLQSEPASAWPISDSKCLLVADVCGNPAWTPCKAVRRAAADGVANAAPEPGAVYLVLAGLAAAGAITARQRAARRTDDGR